MNRMHTQWTIAWGLLLLAGLLMTLTGCGPGRPPGVTPEPLTEMAPPQTTPDSGAVEPVVSLFQSPIQTPTPTPTPWIEPPPPTRRPTPTATQLPPTPVWISPTPFPTLTPAPTFTPAPGVEGFVLYQRKDPEGEVIYRLPVDAVGRAVAPAARIPDSLGQAGPLYPSPDGRYVAIIHGVETGHVISILQVASGQITSLIKDLRAAAFGVPGQFLHWHPNSREVLYKTIEGSEPGLWRVDIHSGEHKVVAQPNPPDGITGGAISPDGQVIIYAWYRSIGYPGQIWKINADGSEPRLIAEGGAPYIFSWSPKGDYLVYAGGQVRESKGAPATGGPLWIMDASSQKPQPLRGPFIFGWGFQPVWSPDGQWLAFTGQEEGQEFGCDQKGSRPDLEICWFQGAAVYTENILTGEIRRLASGLDPAWSLDGTMITFVSQQSGSAELWVINADGSGLRQLTNEGRAIRYPVWLRQ